LHLLVFRFFLGISTSQGIVWKEHPQNDLFCDKWNIKHQVYQSQGMRWIFPHTCKQHYQ